MHNKLTLLDKEGIWIGGRYFFARNSQLVRQLVLPMPLFCDIAIYLRPIKINW